MCRPPKLPVVGTWHWIRWWSVRKDFRNFFLALAPGRLNKDWQNTKDQLDDLRARLERETDYVAEAAVQEQVRSLFREDDGIVVPRVYPEYSTARILTMDRLDGVHIDKFIARDPSQEERNEFACKMIRTWSRMVYAGRLSYADWHPGNFLIMDDGRLGLIDFGFVVAHGDEERRLLRLMDRGNTTGRREDRIAAMKEWSLITDDPVDAGRLRLDDEFAEWCWLAHDGARRSISVTKSTSAAVSICSSRWSASAITEPGHRRRRLPA